MPRAVRQQHDETVRPHLPTEAADEVLADGRVYGYLGLIIIYRSAVRQSKRVTRRILLGNAPPHWRSSPTIQAWQAMGAPPGHCVRSSTRRRLDVAVRLPRRQPLRRGGQARQALKISCRGTPPTRAAAAPRETKSLRISSHRRARGEGGGLLAAHLGLRSWACMTRPRSGGGGDPAKHATQPAHEATTVWSERHR